MNSGKVCVSVCAETVNELIANIRRAEEFADVIEVRFDCLRKEELEDLIRATTLSGGKNAVTESATKPVISTLRPAEQGGRRDLSSRERFDFWSAAQETEYCDLEEELVDDSRSWLCRHRISSYHDFSGVPPNIVKIFDRLADTNAEIVKIAVHTDDAVDGIEVWKLIDRARSRRGDGADVIPIAMGQAGKWTRLLGLAHGAFLTYASLEHGRETAAGQISASDLIDTYRVKELTPETAVYGVIGDPVARSLSPYIHNAAFRADGVDAVFLPLLVKNLGEFMRRMVRRQTREVELNFHGFAVTMPHKRSVIAYLDDIDRTAEAIGAVNTIRIEGDKLTGHNTDADGFIIPLKKALCDLANARVAVFGSGGAARACIYALKRENADVTIFARDAAKASTLAEELTVQIKELDRAEVSEFDVIVNATPVGMADLNEGASLVEAEQLRDVKMVYDLVTKASETPLLKEAAKAGVPSIGGVEMLIAQAARQFEIWTGREAPVALMETTALERLNR